MSTETKAQHTPGPWGVSPDGYIHSIGGGFVPLRTPFRRDAFDDGPNRSDHPEDELQANARLIAAAPAMYEALEKSLAILMQDSETLGQANARQRRDAKRLMRAALAAARGE